MIQTFGYNFFLFKRYIFVKDQVNLRNLLSFDQDHMDILLFGQNRCFWFDIDFYAWKYIYLCWKDFK